MASDGGRLSSIDAFRGLAIVLMVAANYLAGVASVPPWLKHAPDVGLTVIDLIAPAFITAIGLTYVSSAVVRRERSSPREAVLHHLRRYLAIAGIGAILSAGEALVMRGGGGSPWGVLQAIGCSGVLALPLVFAPSWARLAAGLCLLAGYQFLLDGYWLELVLASSHGGLQGVLGWGAMLCLATVLGDLFRDGGVGPARRASAALAFVGSGLLVGLVVPVSKNRVSASYVLLSLGICAVAYLVLQALCDRRGWRSRHLEAWGANPLLLYLLHELALGLVVLPGVPGWYREAPAWLVVVELAVLLGALGAVAEALRRRHTVLTL